MKVCLILLASLILVSLAQKMDPVECDWEKEWMCPGEWNEDKQPISPDYCIPIKVGDCYNYCPVGDWYCGKDRILCPGSIDINGCKELDSCWPGKFCPPNCDWENEMECAGPWDPKTGESTGPNTCMPYKIGECHAHCPISCYDSEVMCPGITHSDGCKDADYCISGKFCPANCDLEKELHCSGEKDPKTGDLITSDTCIPKYNADGCWNQCPETCQADMQWCTKSDTNGCESGWCDSAKFCFPDCNWEKQQVCPGKMDPNTGDQISADYCMSKEDGFGCTIYCPMNCGEKETLCPGKVDSAGCNEPDYCYHGKSCPEDTGKCESLMICNDMKCNDIVGSQSEIIPGWTNDGLDAGPWRLPKWDYVWEVCGKDEAWYGWKLHSGVGSISTTFTASGSAELSFGNCWAFGTVKVYLDDIEIASAGPIEHKTVVFDFQTGAVLSIRDEGDNSIIQISKFEILTCI